jgi:hypothetical protein
MMMSISMLMNL